MKSRIILITWLIIQTINISAQSIHGRIIDYDSIGIPYANVVLLNDSDIIDGTITDEEGRFSFKESKNASKIKITKVGYKDILSLIPNDGDFGNILMHGSVTELSEIIVHSRLPMTRISTRGMITKIDNSILADIGTADDVLSKLPLITGTEGDFTVFGRGKPIIYINNKIITNPAELRQLSSKDIKSVEVISNPGVEFSAETKAVVIIRTTIKKGDGFSIDIYNSTRAANYCVNTSNLTLNYRYGGLDVSANGYFYNGKRKFKDLNTMTSHITPTITENFESITTTSSSDYYAKLRVNYQPNAKHSFGAYYEYGNERLNHKGSIESNIRADNELTTQFHQQHQGHENYYPSHESNIYYQGEIGKLSIDFNCDYLQKRLHKDNIQYEFISGTNPNEVMSNSQNTSRMIAEKLKISYPLWKGTIELGEEYTNSATSFVSHYTGTSIPGGDINIKENNISGFLQFTHNFGICQTDFGIRYEHAVYKYYDTATLNHSLSRTYNNLFPFISISGKLRDVSLSLNFTSHTQRPAYSQLDGTILYVNKYTYQGGNPYLAPTTIYSSQLMAQWKFLFAQCVYSYDKNSIFSMIDNYGTDPFVKIMTFENIRKYQSFQFSLGIQPKFRHWTPQFMAGVFCDFYDPNIETFKSKKDIPYAFINWDNSIKLPKDWIIDADLFAKTAGYNRNYYMKASGYLNLGVRKLFLNGKLSLSMKMNDIFNTNSIKTTLYSGRISLKSEHLQESRNFVFTLRYNFNNTESKYRGTGAGNEERKRF